MLPKSVSLRSVRLASASSAALLCIALELTAIKLVHVQIRFWGIYFLFLFVLVPTALWGLGIRVRSRSVERFHAPGCDDGPEAAVDLPIRIIRQGPRLIRATSIALFLGGLVCLVLALCIALTWFSPPRAREDPLPLTLGSLGIGFVLMAGAFLVRRCKPESLCEISEKGIRAPDGFWGRQTLVPWGELARCEIIHDDERIWYDYFVLWDRAGRHRFKSSRNWLGLVRQSERTRILSVLRSRFPQNAKPDWDAEPVLAGVASSGVWDRELDG